MTARDQELHGRFFEATPELSIIHGHYIGYLSEGGRHVICIQGWGGAAGSWVWGETRGVSAEHHTPIPEDDPRVDAWSAKLALLTLKGDLDE